MLDSIDESADSPPRAPGPGGGPQHAPSPPRRGAPSPPERRGAPSPGPAGVASDSDSSDGEGAYTRTPGLDTTWTGEAARPFWHQISGRNNQRAAAQARQAPRGLPRAILDQVPTWRSRGPQDGQCLVCLSDFEPGERVRGLPCFHIYRQACVDAWLQRSTLCPLCKRPVAEEEGD